MNITEKIIELIPKSKNINDIILKLGKKSGGGITKKIRDVIVSENIDTSHFIKFTPKPLKYNLIEKICPACNNKFETQDGLKHEKFFCSKSCANRSRITSEETKEKIRKTLLKRIDDGIHKIPIGNSELIIAKRAKIFNKTCEYCKKNFIVNSRHSNQICCSQSCASTLSWKSGAFKDSNFSLAQKKAYENGSQKIGGGRTKWFKYKDIKVQGTYELRACLILDKLKEGNKIYNWEYTNDRIKYIGIDGKTHNYLIGFKIWETPNSDFYYLETKGFIMDNDEVKWKTTREKGYKLIVWFLADIKKKETELNLKNEYKDLLF